MSTVKVWPALLVATIFILSLSGSAGANVFGSLELTTTTANPQGEWGTDLSALALVRIREWSDSFRWDAEGRAIIPGEDEQTAQLELSRLSLLYYGATWDLSLGKQPITWGVGQSWPEVESPLNIYPENVWGANLRIPTGPLGFWNMAAAEVDEKTLFALRKQDYYEGLRWSVLGALDSERMIIGFDGKIDVGFELYSDVAVHLRPQQELQLLVGADYQLGPFVAVSEVRFDGLAAEERQKHVFQGLSYSLDDFTSLAAGLDLNLDDRSQLWTLGVETLLTNELTMQAGASFPRGGSASEYGLMQQRGEQIYTLQVSIDF